MELDREQIIKALECCHSSNVADCKQCTYRGKADGEEDLGITCLNLLVRDALELIKELSKENERLNLENAGLEAGAKHAAEFLRVVTVRKMQERLKAEARYIVCGNYCVSEYDIDQIAKDMLEGADED